MLPPPLLPCFSFYLLFSIYISVSTPAIAGIVVFAVVFIAAILMFIFYRRRRSEKQSAGYRKTPSQAVKHSPITVQTTTYQLTSPKPIPAAPDYSKFGLGRRSTNNNMLENSSSEDERFDTEEQAQKFDWSSTSRRRRKASPAKDEMTIVDNIDGLYWRCIILCIYYTQSCTSSSPTQGGGGYDQRLVLPQIKLQTAKYHKSIGFFTTWLHDKTEFDDLREF